MLDIYLSQRGTASRRARHAADQRRFGPRALPWLAVGIAGLGCALYLTGHLWGDPSHRIIAGNNHDIRLFSWYFQHDAWCLTHGHNPFIFSTMNAPAGVNGMWNTSIVVPGVLLAPVTLLGSATLSYNVLVVGGLVISTLAGFALLRRLVQSWIAAAVGALLFAFSPAVIASGIGHVNLQITAAIPIVLLLLHSIVTGRRHPAVLGGLLGVTTAIQLLTGEEVLFQAALAAVVVLVVASASRPRHIRSTQIRRLAIGLVTGLVVCLLLAGYPLWVQFFGPHHQHGSPFGRTFFEADARGFVTPSGRYWLSTSANARFAAAYNGGAPEYLAYLGIPLIAVAAVTGVLAWRRFWLRAALVTGLVFAVFSLGSDLLVGGHHHDVWLPWRALQNLPVFAAALPGRFALVVALAAATVLAVALDWLAARRTATMTTIAAVVGVVCLAPLVPKPYPVAAVTPTPPFFHHVTQWIPANSTVLVVPFPTATVTQPLAWQTASDMAFRMPGGYFIGPDATGQAYIGGPGLRPTAALLNDIGRTGQSPAITPAVRQAATADLDYWRADAVVLGPSPHRAALASFLTAVLRKLPTSADGVLLWRR